MGLLSLFKRNSDDAGEVPARGSAREAVQQARARARHRLIGAVVLLAIGIIGFPLIFESAPRPIPVDIPIEIPSRDAARPLPMPASKAHLPAPDMSSPPPRAAAAPDTNNALAPAAAADAAKPAAATPAPAAASTEPALAPAVPAAAPEKTAAKAAPASPEPVAATAAAPVRSSDGARARALLEGRMPPGRDGGAYVVQVGAFADAASALDMSRRLDKLGYKAYTEKTQTAAGTRVRVRLGPYTTRDEAERVSAKLKAASVASAVMTR